MATQNLNDHECGASQMQGLRAKLTDADALTQAAADAIAAAARGAAAMLALDAHALDCVRHLLGLIVAQAGGLKNDINSIAEEAGANWEDKRDREASERLWAQHHALHGTPRAAAQNRADA
jgi:hypothetical protein